MRARVLAGNDGHGDQLESCGQSGFRSGLGVFDRQAVGRVGAEQLGAPPIHVGGGFGLCDVLDRNGAVRHVVDAEGMDLLVEQVAG